jgi:hypothetical protein
MFDLFDIILDSTFEAAYICCWFSFLGTIFYKLYVEPLKYKQLLLYSSICKIRNILNIDHASNQEITIQLTDIQSRLQKLIQSIDDSNSEIEEDVSTLDNSKQDIDIPIQSHIIFPHFIIYPQKKRDDEEIYLLSCNLSKFLGIKMGATCMSLDKITDTFIKFVNANLVVKNDTLLMIPSVKELFGITDNSHKIKISECCFYLKPHLKNKTQ